MVWLMVVQALITLWLAWACWRYACAAARMNAALWQALAELRIHHNELEAATDIAFGVIDARFDELDGDDVITVAPPPALQLRKLPETAPAGGQLMAAEACGCDEAKALRAELVELRAAAYPVLAWVGRNGGGRDAVERLERALAATPNPKPARCSAHLGHHGIICELPTGHGGEHRCCQIGWL